MDSNNTRARKKNEWRKNKEAFDHIIGDPFSLDGKEGAYITLKKTSTVGSIDVLKGESKGRVEVQKPSLTDFFCDVDLIIREVIDDPIMLDRFFWTYIMGSEDIDAKTRNKLEQKLGKLFRLRGISPIQKYFTVITR